MWEDVMWVGVPREELRRWGILEGDLTGRFAYFRCEVQAEENSALRIRITASSRYRLWVNGHPVLSGPCKGDLYRRYFEETDVTEYLVPGKNVLAAQVLYSDPYSVVDQYEERAAIFGVLGAGGGHRLAVEGEVRSAAGNAIGTVSTGKAAWKVYLDGSYYLKSTHATENLGAICEEIDFRETLPAWKKPEFCDEDWALAQPLETVMTDSFRERVGLIRRFPVREREIPLLYEVPADFSGELKREKQETSGLLERGEMTVAAHDRCEIILDVGFVTNGYPQFYFCGGAGSRIVLTYFEKFMNPDREIPRDDWKNGMIEGRSDSLILDGSELCFEPFWYCTFRFIRMEIETDRQPLTVRKPCYRKTGYPLRAESFASSSAAWVSGVWEICVRTLENCMMETFMDCPYYEQMQFPMDTRLQSLFCCAVSRDVRLVRKALEDLHSSITPEGLVQGKFPSAYPQIISTFSLHYIYMLEEYYTQTGDLDTVRRYLPDIDRICGYYDRKRGALGLAEHLGYWEFVDWQPDWADCGGIPRAALSGPSAIINLMYGYALLCGAELNEAAGRPGMAMEYRDRQKEIAGKIQEYCWDSDAGMYREGPDCRQFTQHAQAWAVLNGLAEGEQAAAILRNAIREPEVLHVTFSTSYEWFRALEKAGLYREARENILEWAGFLDMGCTTCPETPGISRSECHAWSALPLYEFMRCVAGIRPAAPGWTKAVIRPDLSWFETEREFCGQAAVPEGVVKFRYERTEEKGWKYQISLPDGLDACFIYPDGSRRELKAGGEYVL